MKTSMSSRPLKEIRASESQATLKRLRQFFASCFGSKAGRSKDFAFHLITTGEPPIGDTSVLYRLELPMVVDAGGHNSRWAKLAYPTIVIVDLKLSIFVY